MITVGQQTFSLKFSFNSYLDFLFSTENLPLYSNPWQIKIMILIFHIKIFSFTIGIFLSACSLHYIYGTPFPPHVSLVMSDCMTMWTPVDICHVVRALTTQCHVSRAYSICEQVWADCFLELSFSQMHSTLSQLDIELQLCNRLWQLLFCVLTLWRQCFCSSWRSVSSCGWVAPAGGHKTVVIVFKGQLGHA